MQMVDAVGSMGWISLHQLLVGGAIDQVSGKPTSLWSNRLVLPDLDVIDHAKLDSEAKVTAVRVTRSLRGRHLEGAVITSANLRKVDFIGAHLQSAHLDGVDLREATLCETRSDSESGLTYHCADLRGAALDAAQLQGDILSEAPLQGACLFGAQLQGAKLTLAQLQGADLEFAQLQGADLAWAKLQGADLAWAKLQGADLAWAQLQGANLAGADLRAALLESAGMQGTKLWGAYLDGASLSDVFVWRADTKGAEGEALVISPKTEPIVYPGKLDCPAEQTDNTGQPTGLDPCEWSEDSYGALRQLIDQQVPEGDRRKSALKAIANLNPIEPLKGEGAEDGMVEAWHSLDREWASIAGSEPALIEYSMGVANLLREIGCDAEGAPFVISGLLRNFSNHDKENEKKLAILAVASSNEKYCPGARGLPEEDKAKLQKLWGVEPIEIWVGYRAFVAGLRPLN
jgi:uncharacterized protein YjbI with pentapeptide repeats